MIDMTGVAGQPDYGKVAPLPGDDLDRWFGTRRPDTAAVERGLGERLSGFARWHGAYVVACAGDHPDMIHFFDRSGD